MPGDIIVVLRGKATCDMVLLHGSCLAEESMLSGEVSLPHFCLPCLYTCLFAAPAFPKGFADYARCLATVVPASLACSQMLNCAAVLWHALLLQLHVMDMQQNLNAICRHTCKYLCTESSDVGMSLGEAFSSGFLCMCRCTNGFTYWMHANKVLQPFIIGAGSHQ